MREVAIPAVGFAMTEALLIDWTRQPGDAVAAGDPIAEIETDKTTAELEAPIAGILGRHRFAAGDVVPVGVALTVILAPGETEDGTAALQIDSVVASTPIETTSVAAPAAASGPIDGSGRTPRRVSPRQQAGARSDTPASSPLAAATTVAEAAAAIIEPDAPLRLDGIDPDVALGWLREMLRIREFESRCDPLVLAGKIAGGVHLSLGQEAVAVGVAAALRPGDLAAGTHRSHHHALAMGIPSTTLMAELFGRSSGSNGGRGGSMHVAALDRGFIGGNGIVGAGVGLASGAALSAKLRESGQVVVGYVGDGGVNTGRTWESINLASVWRLPLIVVCENNLYAVETPISAVTASASIVERARASGSGRRPWTARTSPRSSAPWRPPRPALAPARARPSSRPGRIGTRVTARVRRSPTGRPKRSRAGECRDPISRLQAALAAAGALDGAAFDVDDRGGPRRDRRRRGLCRGRAVADRTRTRCVASRRAARASGGSRDPVGDLLAGVRRRGSRGDAPRPYDRRPRDGPAGPRRPLVADQGGRPGVRTDPRAGHADLGGGHARRRRRRRGDRPATDRRPQLRRLRVRRDGRGRSTRPPSSAT